MDYCVPNGIPHSVFLGRVVRPGRDPQWTEADRGYALAWTRNKAETCPGCGTRPDEWADDPYAYVVDTHFCRGHQVLAAAEAESKIPKTADGKDAPGWFTYLRPSRDDDFED